MTKVLTTGQHRPDRPAADRWLVPPGKKFDLAKVDPSTTAGAPGDKVTTATVTARLREELGELQVRLWAEQRQALLVVLQAIDGGGKDGTIRHVFRGLNPQGCRVTSFKVPTEEELGHDFLWRVHRHVPARGEIGVFNRSHYEDVLVVRVHDLVPRKVWDGRYRIINDFEHGLAAAGTRIVKVLLHISKEEQARRFRERLGDPEKRWKFRLGDIEERKRWDDYQVAFGDAVERTSTGEAPWYVVPADAKWYRNWAVAGIVAEALRSMDPRFPPAEVDPASVVVE